jgi:uncharacterized protein (DUF305 family)
MKRGWILGLFLLLALASFSAALADAPVDGRPGRAEVRFLEGMIDHHQMALDMANDCLATAATGDVQAICQNVIAAQSAEIEQMQAYLLDWYNIAYAPMPMMAMMMDDDGMMDHDQMNHDAIPATDLPMMMGMMAGLNRAQGEAYDVAWLEAMIDHHDDAIHMAERVLERAEHDDLRQLAGRIIADQTAETEQMEALLNMFAA